MAMNLATAFALMVDKNPQKKALFWGESEYSYQDLLDQSFRVAGHLRAKLGVKPGDRVALWLKNCPEFIPSLFGILFAGGVVVPVNNFLKPDEVAFILNDCGADVLITDAVLAAALPELLVSRPGLQCLQVEQFGADLEKAALDPPTRLKTAWP